MRISRSTNCIATGNLLPTPLTNIFHNLWSSLYFMKHGFVCLTWRSMTVFLQLNLVEKDTDVLYSREKVWQNVVTLVARETIEGDKTGCRSDKRSKLNHNHDATLEDMTHKHVAKCGMGVAAQQCVCALASCLLWAILYFNVTADVVSRSMTWASWLSYVIWNKKECVDDNYEMKSDWEREEIEGDRER